MNENEINKILEKKLSDKTNQTENNINPAEELFNSIKAKELKNRIDIISIAVLGIILVFLSMIFIVFSDSSLAAQENKPNKKNIVSGSYTKMLGENYAKDFAFKNFFYNIHEFLKAANSLGTYKADFIYSQKNDEYELYYPNKTVSTENSSAAESSRQMQEVKKDESRDAGDSGEEDFKIDMNGENMLATSTATTTVPEISQEESTVQEQTTTVAISAPNVTVTTTITTTAPIPPEELNTQQSETAEPETTEPPAITQEEIEPEESSQENSSQESE